MSLESYLESGELPSDPAELERLYHEAIGSEAEESDEKQDEAGEKPAGAASGAKSEKADEREPDGILTRDGKHVIPYDALKSEREARQLAAREAAELRAEIERLKNPEASATASNLVFAKLSETQLRELQEYFPEQYEAIAAQQAAALAAEQKLMAFEQQELQRQAAQQQHVALTVQEEIDNNPILSHWQRNDPEAWQACIDLDNRLRANPNNANLSMTERFAKVAAAMTQIYDSPVKATLSTVGKTSGGKPTPPPAAKPIINSLSDVPGGEPQEASERQRIEDSTTAEMGDRLMKMTEDQRVAFLNSLG